MAKRETQYPVRVTVNLPEDLGAAIYREADRADEAATRTVREAVRIGFPVLRERRRKARRAHRGGPSVAPREEIPETGQQRADSTAPDPDDALREGHPAAQDLGLDGEGARGLIARLRALERAHLPGSPRMGGAWPS